MDLFCAVSCAGTSTVGHWAALQARSSPRPAPGPLSPYNPIFNPIIAVTTPNTQASTSMQTQVTDPVLDTQCANVGVMCSG